MINILYILKITGSVILLLFLPGLFLSFIFFRGKTIDAIERFALSFALSITVVPLLVFYTNLLGIPVRSGTVLAQILGIIALSVLIMVTRHIFYPKK